ncbi:MAG: carboxypeptidase regulatory-like domain-containing protein [Methanofollis sp.]|uniref:carboxypeptidase regulatory-like domain-containing protein n=1 Tax=Methanofollis sp. TaxID=2052835 RepID=UPI0026092081|nr:carboxypeptidase regulatory-like domain-containing protein [Methanofollis sp.]MDD4255657.1 carboxypeptidase regulatory-like domain-containing protein [Methanofollis sp.]
MVCKLRILIIAALALLLCGTAVQASTLVDVTVKDADDGTALKGATVYVDGSDEGTTDSRGEVSYRHTESSRYNLKVTKSGYKDWYERIDADDTSVAVRMDRDSLDLKITVYDADTFLPVSGVWVEIANKVSGEKDSEKTDSTGLATFEVKANEDYSVEVEAKGYDLLQREIEIDDEVEPVQFWLYPEGRFAFRVLDARDHVPIANATVKVGGTVRGTTGRDGFVTTVLDTDRRYLVEVTHPAYSDYCQEVSIPENAVLTDIFLSKSTYPVFISVYDAAKAPLAGASVSVDGKDVGVTDNYGRFSLESVVAGTHAIEVRAPGYVAWQGSCNSRDQKTDLVAELVPVSVPVAVIVGSPDHKALAGVAIGVNGTDRGVTGADGILKLDIEPGSYNVSGMLDGYKPTYLVQQVPIGSSGESCSLTMQPSGLPLGIIGVVAVILVLVAVAGVVVAGKVRTPSRRNRRPGRRGGF